MGRGAAIWMKAEGPGPHLQSSALAGTPPIPPLRESGCARTVVARAYLILEMKELKPVPGQELSLVLPVRRHPGTAAATSQDPRLSVALG